MTAKAVDPVIVTQILKDMKVLWAQTLDSNPTNEFVAMLLATAVKKLIEAGVDETVAKNLVQSIADTTKPVEPPYKPLPEFGTPAVSGVTTGSSALTSGFSNGDMPIVVAKTAKPENEGFVHYNAPAKVGPPKHAKLKTIFAPDFTALQPDPINPEPPIPPVASPKKNPCVPGYGFHDHFYEPHFKWLAGGLKGPVPSHSADKFKAKYPRPMMECDLSLRVFVGGSYCGDFTGSDFFKANLRGFDFVKSILKNCDFSGADLTDAILPEDFKVFEGSKWTGAILVGAKMSPAVENLACFSDAIFAITPQPVKKAGKNLECYKCHHPEGPQPAIHYDDTAYGSMLKQPCCGLNDCCNGDIEVIPPPVKKAGKTLKCYTCNNYDAQNHPADAVHLDVPAAPELHPDTEPCCGHAKCCGEPSGYYIEALEPDLAQ